MDDLNRPYRRDRSSALAAIFNSSLTAFQVGLGAIMPIIRSDLGISLTIASLHFTIIAAFGMLASHLTSAAAGRVGRGRIIVISLSVCVIAFLLMCFAPSVRWTLAASVLLGFAGPFGLILTQSEMLDRHPHHRATATAELTLIVSVFMFLTTVGAGPLVDLFNSWRVVLLIPTVALMAMFVLLPPMQFTDRLIGGGARTAGTMTPLAWLFCLLIIAQTGFEWCYGYLGAEFMNKAGGLTKAAAASSLSFYYAGLVLGRLALLPAVRRFSPSQLLATSFGTACFGFLLVAGGPSIVVKVTGLFLSGLGISFAFPLIATMAAAAFPNASDWIIGRIYTAGGLAIAVAPFMIGTLGDAVGIGVSFWAVGLLGLMGLLATSMIQRMPAPN